MYISYFQSPIGALKITADNQGISGLSLCNEKLTDTNADISCSFLLQAHSELDEYFSGKRKNFSMPLSLHGTEFQIKVWNALCNIPYGETRSYSDIARAVGNPKGCRAVGMANNKNPVMIIVPCHRVIGKNGSLTGYGYGLNIKQALLELENAPVF